LAPTPGQLTPGVIPYQEILELCGLAGNQDAESTATGPIQPCRRENVRSASYDMRLGTAYYFSQDEPEPASGSANIEVAHLNSGSRNHIVLQPNQFVVVSTLEQVCLPADMIGHLTLKQDILLQGLIMGSQSQIDAGYRGWIYPLLYNLTNSKVTLKLGESIIRLELVRLPEPTTRPYEGDYQGKTLAESLRVPIGSSLAKLREEVRRHGEEVEEERQRGRNTRIFATLLAIVAIALPFVTGLVSDVSRLEGEVHESVELEDEVDQLKRKVSGLQCQVGQKAEEVSRLRC
jgi:dCTP deaminase